MSKIIIGFIKGYQKVDFFNLPIFKTLFLTDASCRYSPTCSEYTLQAVTRFGSFYGLYLGFKRIISCNPFSKGGFDPVPSKKA